MIVDLDLCLFCTIANCYSKLFLIVNFPVLGSFDLLDGSCTSLRIEGMKRGHTEITVYYEEQNVKLKTSITVAAYLPLEVIKLHHPPPPLYTPSQLTKPTTI